MKRERRKHNQRKQFAGKNKHDDSEDDLCTDNNKSTINKQ